MGMIATLGIAMGIGLLLIIGVWIVVGTVVATRDRADHRRRHREHRRRPQIDIFKRPDGDAGSDEAT